jgi:hypothetical protein
MSQDLDLTIALELEEARAAHAKLVSLIEQRMRQLDELWRTAKPADRLLAVQRLIQTGALAQKVTAELEVRNERVREKMSNARTDRKKLERLVAEGAPDTKENLDLRHKVFRLELEAQRAEQERDEYIDEQDLRGPLYFCGETFVRTEPFAPHEAPLKDLAPRAKALAEVLADLERRAPRKGARFTTTTPDGREKTLIRMLPALSMESEPVS